MVLNPAKAKVLLITTSQRRSRCQESLSFKYTNIALEVTTGDKGLGIVLNQNFKWDEHFGYIKKKIATIL